MSSADFDSLVERVNSQGQQIAHSERQLHAVQTEMTHLIHLPARVTQTEDVATDMKNRIDGFALRMTEQAAAHQRELQETQQTVTAFRDAMQSWSLEETAGFMNLDGRMEKRPWVGGKET